MHAKSLQLCLTLRNSMDCSVPDSSVHGMLQARILEWVAMPSSKASSYIYIWASQEVVVIKNPLANAGDVKDAGQEDPLEEGMATHSSILAWSILWTEEPGGPNFRGSQRVEHN